MTRYDYVEIYVDNCGIDKANADEVFRAVNEAHEDYDLLVKEVTHPVVIEQGYGDDDPYGYGFEYDDEDYNDNPVSKTMRDIIETSLGVY